MTERAWRIEAYDELPSTQDAAVQRARAGEPEGLAILARRQTSGRGSRGRGWTAPEGNLNLSLLLRPQTAATAGGVWALLAGLSLIDALRLEAPLARLQLKWPNDVMLRTPDGQWSKLAGILIDSAATSAGGLDWLVIGLGANLAMAPSIEGRTTAALAEIGVEVAPARLASAILDALTRHKQRWEREGEPAITTEWQAGAHPLGTRLRVAIGGTEHEGSFDGLAPGGALRLLTDDGVRLIGTGDVFLPTGTEDRSAS